MEIIQAISMPQTASTGSSGASAAGAAGSETGNDGFLALFTKFTSDSAGEDTDAVDATGQTTPDAATIPDGVLSLIAPGLFSNLIIQPQQPASGDAAAGGEAGVDVAALGAAGEAAADPLGALAPDMLQPPMGPRPDLPAKGLAPQPGDGKPAADGGDAAGNEAGQDAEAQLSEEDLAKLVSEGKAILQARQGKTQPDKSEASAIQAQAIPAPSIQAQSAQVPTAQAQSAQAPTAEAQPAQAPTVQAQPAQAQPAQAQTGEKGAATADAVRVQVSREPAMAERAAETRPVGNESPTADSAARDARSAESTDGEPALAADAGTGRGNSEAESGDTAQEGETNGSRQAQQHAARIEKANEQAAQRPEGKDASQTSVRNAEAEPEGRGGAAVRNAPGAADGGGKSPPSGKDRAAEAGPGFEEALVKAKAAHKEPEAAVIGAQAPTAAPAETEAADRAAAPHTRGALPHSAADQVSVQLGKAASGKSDQMVINLKPVELGSVEVKLDFGTDGRVQASIMAERPETLEMLQKDQRTLERALNDAGLQTDAGSLSFNLKGQGQNGNHRQFAGYNQPGGGRGKAFAGIESEGPAIPDFAAPQYSASGANRSRLDIRI